MRIFDNELILNHITAGEYRLRFDKDYEDYIQIAHLFLSHKGKYLFAEDILSQYNEDMTLEKLFEQNKDRFIQGANQEKDGIRQKTWYDIWSTEEIERNDDFFDYFFSCKLRHLSLLDIDELLDFHLEYSFKNNKQEFFRFLQLTMRQYQDELLNPQLIETVHEWIEVNKTIKNNEVQTDFDNPEKIKGRIQREAGDKLTHLSLVQTALLIQFMQESKIILKGDNLTYTQVGKAFNILTGYSAHTLRQQLGTKGELTGVKHEDYKELHAIILQLADLIATNVRKK